MILTTRQQEIYDFIRQSFTENQRMPSIATTALSGTRRMTVNSTATAIRGHRSMKRKRRARKATTTFWLQT